LEPARADVVRDPPSLYSASAGTLRQKRWGGRPPTASTCQSRGVEHHSREASVGEVSTIGLDLAKLVFQAHGADASGGVVFRKKLRRDQVLAFFASQPRCVVAMEACAGAHH